MPNHYWNEIYIEGDSEAIAKVMGKIVKKDANGGERVDFGIILPMPEILRRVVASVGVQKTPHVYDLDASGKVKSKARPATKEEVREIQSHSHKDWYHWAINTWGTKWNAYNNVIEHCEKYGELMLGFMTAWNPPHGWLDEVKSLCIDSGLEFYHRGWDEDDQPRLLGRLK